MAKFSFLMLLLLPGLLVAQGNYVANSPNNSTTATYGSFNTFVGPGAGNSGHATGNRNTAMGYNAGSSQTTSDKNSFYGVDAGRLTTKGSENVFVGFEAGLNNTEGYYNTFIGRAAGYSMTTATYNTFVGYSAGYSTTTGYQNIFIGFNSGKANTTGSDNTFVGGGAGFSNLTGTSNTFIGGLSGFHNTTGHNNIFVGSGAGLSTTIGSENVVLGDDAGESNVTGSQNVLIGTNAGLNSTAGKNTFVGYNSGLSTTTGSNNTFVGLNSGLYTTTGSNNILIGPNSGTAITDGNDNVLMGYNSQAEDGLQNAIAIGANSRVAISNSLILGNGANVGIGTSAPTDRLEVVSPYPDRSGVRLTNLTTASPTYRATDQFLTVSETGEVVKARYQLRINSPSEWSDQVFAPTYPLRSLSAVAAYINQHGHLPGVPSAEQVTKEGLDLVRMNATLLEKVEELTLYSIEQDKKASRQEAINHQQQAKIEHLEHLLNQLLKKK